MFIPSIKPIQYPTRAGALFISLPPRYYSFACFLGKQAARAGWPRVTVSRTRTGWLVQSGGPAS